MLGRPSLYSQQTADLICNSIACSSKGLHRLHKEIEGFPHPETIFRWIRDNKDFNEQYARAREEQAEFMAEEMIEIADDSSGDAMAIRDRDGEEMIVENREFANRSRLRVDTRKWIASKLKPKKFGDKIEIEGNMNVVTSVAPVVQSTGRKLPSSESEVQE